MEKICESCGMPMVKKEDFGGLNINNKYCVFCTYENGELKTFDEKVKDYSNFIMRTSDLGESQAIELAKESLLKQPAWKNIK